MPLDKRIDHGAEIKEYKKGYREMLRESKDLYASGRPQDAVDAANEALYAAIRISDVKNEQQNANAMAEEKFDIMDRYRISRANSYIFRQENGEIKSASYTVMAGLVAMWAGAFELQWAFGAEGGLYPVGRIITAPLQMQHAPWFPVALFAGVLVEGTGMFVTAVGTCRLWIANRK